MTTSKHLGQNFKTFLQLVDKFKQKHQNFSPNFKLVAVSKKFPVEDILEVYKLGQKDFGENYLNEAIEKIDAIDKFNINITWHYLGQIQSRKAKQIAQNFSWVHSLDRFDIAEKLNSHRPADKDKLNILIQVNLQQDPHKSGISPDEVDNFVKQIIQLKNLRLRGLMCILKQDCTDYQEQFEAFTKLKAILKLVNKTFSSDDKPLDTLSMGMSGDVEAAIAAGSTMIRIGSAIFGARES